MSTTTDTPARQRTFASDVEFKLGMVSLTADVVGVRRPNLVKATAFTNVCPECVEPIKVTQSYACQQGHGPFILGELHKAREVEGTFIKFDEQARAKIKEGEGETGTMELRVCPRVQIEASVRPDEGQYRIRLNKKKRGADVYSLLLKLASDPEQALYGVCRLNDRTQPSWYLLEDWGGQLTMQSLIRPQDLAAHDDQELPDLDDAAVRLGKTLMGQLSQSFDPELLANTRVARLEQVSAELVAAGPSVPSAPVAVAAAPGNDLMSLLAQALAA